MANLEPAGADDVRDEEVLPEGLAAPPQGVVGGQTPDITSAQILSVVTGVISLLVAFALVNDEVAQRLIGAFGVIVPAVVVLADSIIRNGRARMMAPPNVIQVHTGDTHASDLAAQDQRR